MAKKKGLTDAQYRLVLTTVEATNREWVRGLSWETIAGMLHDKMAEKMYATLFGWPEE